MKHGKIIIKEENRNTKLKVRRYGSQKLQRKSFFFKFKFIKQWGERI